MLLIGEKILQIFNNVGLAILNCLLDVEHCRDI